ncbi:Leucine-rich repeat - like 10 [Theobroma cacao]|nr:Leucine-rich repeat - like 10 [Theobroma cacao]
MINISQQLGISNSPWNSTKEPNPCRWEGVTCNIPLNNSIVSLSLSGFGLSTSKFLPMFCQIGSLQSLNLSNNFLVSIPDEFFISCGRIDGLKSLDFSKNKLVGSLPTFHNFVGLESLDFSFNSLSGSIDSQLNDLGALKILNLSFNGFKGYVPSRIGQPMILEQLVLSKNDFTGPIPTDIGIYKNLALLDLSVNSLSGPIPESIGNLTKLQILILSSNRLTGLIPATLSSITTLQRRNQLLPTPCIKLPMPV